MYLEISQFFWLYLPSLSPWTHRFSSFPLPSPLLRPQPDQYFGSFCGISRWLLPFSSPVLPATRTSPSSVSIINANITFESTIFRKPLLYRVDVWPFSSSFPPKKVWWFFAPHTWKWISLVDDLCDALSRCWQIWDCFWFRWSNFLPWKLTVLFSRLLCWDVKTIVGQSPISLSFWNESVI